MDEWERLNETSLPEKDSNQNMEDITTCKHVCKKS